jgi:hypothetical protein
MLWGCGASGGAERVVVCGLDRVSLVVGVVVCLCVCVEGGAFVSVRHLFLLPSVAALLATCPLASLPHQQSHTRTTTPQHYTCNNLIQTQPSLAPHLAAACHCNTTSSDRRARTLAKTSRLFFAPAREAPKQKPVHPRKRVQCVIQGRALLSQLVGRRRWVCTDDGTPVKKTGPQVKELSSSPPPPFSKQRDGPHPPCAPLCAACAARADVDPAERVGPRRPEAPSRRQGPLSCVGRRCIAIFGRVCGLCEGARSQSPPAALPAPRPHPTGPRTRADRPHGPRSRRAACAHGVPPEL